MFALRQTSGTVVLAALIGATSAAAQVSFYDMSTGAFGATNNNTLTGGFYNGLTLAQLNQMNVNLQVTETAGQQFAILNASGFHYYGTAGNFTLNANPVLSGGPFNGQTLGQQFTFGRNLQVRDGVGTPYAILNASGFSFYGSTGVFNTTQNPTLDGGPYSGMTLGQLRSSGVDLRFRNTGGSEYYILDPNGAHFYSGSVGTAGDYLTTFNPTLTGGPYAGFTLGQLSNFGAILSFRDNAGTGEFLAVWSVSQVPEPSALSLLCVPLAASMAWRLRRRGVAKPNHAFA